MIKLIVFVTRRDDLSPQAFQDYWRQSHGPLVRGMAVTGRTMRGYVQGMTVLEAYEGAQLPAYDGTAELYFDSQSDADAFFGDAEYLAKIQPDESNFADLSRCAFIPTSGPEIVCGPEPADAQGVKLMIGVKRRPDMTLAAWRDHMRTRHAPLVRDHATSQRYLTGYIQCFTADGAYAQGEPAVDATSELYFPDLAAMQAFLDDPAYRSEVFTDGAENADMSRTVFFPTREETVIPVPSCVHT
ncbi:EthD domain-containing protein [Rhodovibrio salinarum]|nr:EthD domain-containing protein [Rhodovibrio salinarum]